MKRTGMTLKEKARKFFTKTKSVKCPAFKDEEISFNSKGLNHLFYKRGTSKRNLQRVTTNIRLLPLAVDLLKLLPIPQEEDFYTVGRKKYRFWAFEGVVNSRRIKVVVRQVGNGNKHFYSVIPVWRRDRFGSIRNSKGPLSET